MESNIILYSNGSGTVSINVTYQNESFWLSQKAIAQLFDCSADNDVLQFVDTETNFKPIDNLSNPEDKKGILAACYKWLQESSNPIRNRIILSNIKSTDIIRRINSTTH